MNKLYSIQSRSEGYLEQIFWMLFFVRYLQCGTILNSVQGKINTKGIPIKRAFREYFN